jgi:hypothetical protein
MIFRLGMHYGYVRKLALYVMFHRWRGWAGCMLLQQGMHMTTAQSPRHYQPLQWQHIVLQVGRQAGMQVCV